MQDVFLRFFVFLLQSYRDYLVPTGSQESTRQVPLRGLAPPSREEKTVEH